MLKFLMICAPFSGHTYPSLPLAEELVSRGHIVHYISTARWRSKIEVTGARFVPYLNYCESYTELQDLSRFFKAAFITAISLHDKYDALIYDAFFYPGSILATRLGIRYIRQIFQPAWNRDAFLESRRDKTYRYLSYKAMLSYWLLDRMVMNRKTAKHLNIPRKRLAISNIDDIAELNIVYVAETFQPYRELFDERFLFTTPENNTIRKTEIEIPYMSMRKPIIYISLGSMISSKAFLDKCIRAFGNKEVSVILSTGKIKPETLGKLPTNIHAYSFVPQLEVLQNVDLFITHGGMNSVNEAINYGVPMLVMPIINDQPVNARRVEELGIGKSMKHGRSASTIYFKAMEILYDNNINIKVKAVQRMAHNGDSISDVANRIEMMFN